jgi:hypothetical protein
MKKEGIGFTIKKAANERWMILIMRMVASVQRDLKAHKIVSRNA